MLSPSVLFFSQIDEPPNDGVTEVDVYDDDNKMMMLLLLLLILIMVMMTRFLMFVWYYTVHPFNRLKPIYICVIHLNVK